MENNKDHFQQSQQGTGSDENTGQDRSRQANTKVDISEEDKQNIASEIKENPDRVSSLKDLGALSGRDDAAGSSGDRMEDQSTRETTAR